MKAIILALGASVAYGTGDFLGGMAARRHAVLGVVVAAQAAGLLGLVAAQGLLPAATLASTDMLWSAAAGLAGAASLLWLYRALAAGRMSVVAPVAGLLSLSVPVAFGVLSGERPGPFALAGIALAALAVCLVGRDSTSAAPASGIAAGGLLAAVGAGLAGGVFYILLERTEAVAGLWPLLAARGVSLAVLGAAAAAGRASLWPSSARVAFAILAAGLLDMMANVLYLLAVREGLLSVVATLSSLYPASTVLLARFALRETLQPAQRAGLALGAIAVPLITAG